MKSNDDAYFVMFSVDYDPVENPSNGITDAFVESSIRQRAVKAFRNSEERWPTIVTGPAPAFDKGAWGIRLRNDEIWDAESEQSYSRQEWIERVAERWEGALIDRIHAEAVAQWHAQQYELSIRAEITKQEVEHLANGGSLEDLRNGLLLTGSEHFDDGFDRAMLHSMSLTPTGLARTLR